MACVGCFCAVGAGDQRLADVGIVDTWATGCDRHQIIHGVLGVSCLEPDGVIDTQYTVDEWRQMAHANLNVAHLTRVDMSSREFSELIREGLPNK